MRGSGPKGNGAAADEEKTSKGGAPAGMTLNLTYGPRSPVFRGSTLDQVLTDLIQG